MKDGDKTREQLTDDLATLRRQIADLEKEKQKYGQAMAALQDSQAELAAVYDGVPVIMILVDRERRVRRANRAAKEAADRPAAEMLGLRGGEALRCLHSLDDPRGCGFGLSCQACIVRRTVLDTLGTGDSHYQVEARLPLEGKDEQGQRDLLVSTSLLDVQQDQMALVCIEDITEQVRIREQLQVALTEREVLLREIHHRVKNNMQAIIYLIDLQSDSITDPRALQVLQQLQGRARTMALVHEQLSGSKNLADINIGTYLHRLAEQLVQAFGTRQSPGLRVQTLDVSMNIDKAVPCGLIVNELVTNALQHAFPGATDGETEERCEIYVGLEANGGEYVLTVMDNGVGLPSGFDWRKTESMGLYLVDVWATHQLGGSIEVNGEGGTTFKIRFADQEWVS